MNYSSVATVCLSFFRRTLSRNFKQSLNILQVVSRFRRESQDLSQLLVDRPPIVFRSLRWSLVALKSKSGKAEAMPGLKAQLQPHSLNASLAEPAYPLVAGVAAPPLHRSDKEPLSFSFLDIVMEREIVARDQSKRMFPQK